MPVPVTEPLPAELLRHEPIPEPPAPDAIDPKTLKPTVKSSTLEKYLGTLMFWAFGIDSQLRDIITAQPEQR